MTTQDLSEFLKIRERQESLEEQVHQLGTEIDLLERKLQGGAPAVSREQAPQHPDTVKALAEALKYARGRATPAMMPIDIAAPPVITTPEPAPAHQMPEAVLPQPSRSRLEEPAVASPAVSHADSGNGDGSLEMKVGTYWLVRVGIVMILTALVFFGNLAYQNFISKLGPSGKVALLYLASFGLVGAGAFLQREKTRQMVKNYGNVLFAGGLAAVYFTTYAAHHFTNLKVITSGLLDGVLLLGWAAVIGWIADRRKSEVLGMFAVGLAFYTSTITRAGYFTLYSNLVLTVIALFFLLRNRWATITIASLFASYGSYAYWRFFDGSNWHWATPGMGLWTGASFLAAYWLVFTVAGVLSRDERIRDENRAFFLTGNNGMFFALFLLTMLQVKEGGLHRFLLTYGAVLLSMAAVSSRFLASEKLTRNAYLTQGLALVTVGVITKFSGLQLALMLGMESVVLVMAGQLKKDGILKAAGFIAAGLSVGWAMENLHEESISTQIAGVGLGLLMVLNAFLLNREVDSARTEQGKLNARPGYFSVLALLIWLVTAWHHCSAEVFPIVLGASGLVLIASVYVLKIRELSCFGQSYVFIALVAVMARIVEAGAKHVSWYEITLTGLIGLALIYWRKRQVVIRTTDLSVIADVVLAIEVLLMAGLWIHPKCQPDAWIAVAAGVALAFTVYGVLTRGWFLAAFAQMFLVMGAVHFPMRLMEAKPAWYLGLAAMAVFALLGNATVAVLKGRPAVSDHIKTPLLNTAFVYRCAAVGLSIVWLWNYPSVQDRAWLLALSGMVAFAWAGWKHSRAALAFSGAYWAVALALIAVPDFGTPTIYWLNFAALCGFLAQQHFARKYQSVYQLDRNAHVVWVAIGTACVWLFVTRWVQPFAGGFYLTASWSALALLFFALGAAFRERAYRWAGLGLLACALGRVVIFDVWKLDTLFRILSFLALGIALIVLGYVYNRFQEKIREWL